MIKYWTKTACLLSIFLCFSCLESTENNDRTPPTIDEAWLNKNDSVLYNSRKIIDPITGQQKVAYDDTIRINKTGFPPDTLVMGHKLFFYAVFSDDKALSSYKIMVDTAQSNVGQAGDIVFSARKSGRLLTQTSDVVNTREIDILGDSLGFATIGNELKPIRAGKYLLTIYVMDTNGNETSAQRDLILISPASLIESRKK